VLSDECRQGTNDWIIVAASAVSELTERQEGAPHVGRGEAGQCGIVKLPLERHMVIGKKV
jgi:hypothetical protein